MFQVLCETLSSNIRKRVLGKTPDDLPSLHVCTHQCMCARAHTHSINDPAPTIMTFIYLEGICGKVYHRGPCICSRLSFQVPDGFATIFRTGDICKPIGQLDLSSGYVMASPLGVLGTK